MCTSQIMDLNENVLDMEEEDEVWNAAYYGPTDSTRNSPTTKFTGPEVASPGTRSSPGDNHDRVIIHIDLDCFYAQVEMLEKPALRNKPLGIQQKYLMVTSNYVARARGVPKYCGVQEALRACPELVLVNGEDLTRYRQVSYKVTEFFQKYTELVERLGFDENFLDVTSLLGSPQWRHLKEKSHIDGHIYGVEVDDPVDTPCSCGCHGNLIAGSHLAADIRRSLYAELGVTCCAGVAHNKLLAKLVGGANKPNQQTTLFPARADQLIQSLGYLRKLPGVGMTMSKKLETLGISTIVDLLKSNTSRLSEEFSGEQITWLHNLARGIDLQAVQKTKPPQSMSDEDSFKKCASATEASTKMGSMLLSVLQRVLCDGRIPGVLRVTVRKVIGEQRKRESRQCPIPSNIFRGFSQGTMDVTRSSLLHLADKLFSKLVDVTRPFHLTVINVCVTKFSDISSPNNNISNFFQANTSWKSEVSNETTASMKVGDVVKSIQPSSESPAHYEKRDRNGNMVSKSGLDWYFAPKQLKFDQKQEICSPQEKSSQKDKPSPVESSCDLSVSSRSSDGSVPTFNADGKHCTECVIHQVSCSHHLEYHGEGKNPKKQRMDITLVTESSQNLANVNAPESATTGQGTQNSWKDDCEQLSSVSSSPDSVTMVTRAVDNLPAGVDPAVFAQLPRELQAEVLAQYHQDRPDPGNVGSKENRNQKSAANPSGVRNQSPTPVDITAGKCMKPWLSKSPKLEEHFENTHVVYQNSQHPTACSMTVNEGQQLCKTAARTVECGQRTITNVSLNINSDAHVRETLEGKPSSSKAVVKYCQAERTGIPSIGGHEHRECPDDVDQEVFSQLPSDIQKELFLEWKRKKLFAGKSGVHNTNNKLKTPKGPTSKTSITKYFFSPNRSNNADRK